MTSNVLAPGSAVGRYQIERFLGAGAMGEVYLAIDPHIERQLAIKTVRVAGGSQTDVDDRKRRLLREARAAGRLLHPNVVTLFDAGEHEGLLYLAFEYVLGSDLSSRLERGPLSLGEILRIVAQAARALDFAHGQGIVHRDIKPSNIMVDEAGRVKVADFGIAKVAGQSTELTMAGSVMGSPQYLSPEQIRGEDLDGRSDIFSLGVVLYELLSGRRPFNGETLTTLVFQILQQEPPPISALRSVPPRLERLLARMLAKDREARFASAGEVADELEAIEREMSRELLTSPVALATEQLDETHLLPPRAATGVPPPPPVSGSLPGLPPLPPPPSPLSATAVPPAPVVAAALPLSQMPEPAAPPPQPAGAGVVREGKKARFLLAAALVAALLGAVLVAGFLFWSRDRREAVAAAPETTDLAAALTTDAAATPAAPVASSVPAPAAPANGPGAAPLAAPGPATVEARPDRPIGQIGQIVPQNVPPASRPAPAPRAPEVREAEPARPVPEVRVPPPAPSVPAERVEDEEEEEPAPPARRSQVTAGGMKTGLNLLLRVNPPDAFFLLDRRMIGRAREYSVKPFRLPDPGSYELKFRREGYLDQVVQIEAEEVAGTRPVSVNLQPLPAAEVDASDLPVHQVKLGVGFKVTPPTALVAVDGRSPVPASQYRGGRRGGWLDLPPGRHRLVFTAAGHRRRDIVVDVTGGAEEERKLISINLPRGED